MWLLSIWYFVKVSSQETSQGSHDGKISPVKCTGNLTITVLLSVCYAKIRPRDQRTGHLHPPRSLPEKLGGDTSVGSCQQPFHVIAEAGWGKASHSGSAMQGFNWKWPEVTQAQKLSITPWVVIRQKFTLNDTQNPSHGICYCFISAVHISTFTLGARIHTNHWIFGLSHRCLTPVWPCLVIVTF